jgi:Domain of unknown function (DUF4168)
MSDVFRNRALIGVLAVCSVITFAAPLSGQETRERIQAADPSTVSDKNLRAFANAYVEYHKIRQTYEARLGKVQDPKEREKIQREGDSKVKQTLEQQKLTPESYNRLFTAVNGNEQLRRKALKWIDEERNRS